MSKEEKLKEEKLQNKNDNVLQKNSINQPSAFFVKKVDLPEEIGAKESDDSEVLHNLMCDD